MSLEGPAMPVATSHSWIVLSQLPEASVLPSAGKRQPERKVALRPEFTVLMRQCRADTCIAWYWSTPAVFSTFTWCSCLLPSRLPGHRYPNRTAAASFRSHLETRRGRTPRVGCSLNEAMLRRTTP